ncbi:MAG TPA: MBL fold metallo-hydrolase [Patescibacteria group bacterium]|nr:MBL fold metallo-hydrolase [Patescibacteria group bacterium]
MSFKRFLLGAAVVCLAVLFVFLFSAWSPLKTEVSFLDVGQGDAILIETSKGRNILIDGGPDRRVVRELSENLDFGEKTLDLVILTHPHADHVTGLNSVVERFNVKRILLPPVQSQAPAFKHLMDISGKQGVVVATTTAPFSVEMGAGCGLDVLYPFPDSEFENLNNASLVSRLQCSGLSFLFTGDIEKEAEERILSRDIDLESDILKVSHHGSDSSSGRGFLRAVSPEAAVIPVGEDNDSGHPSLRVIRKLQREGARILRTDEHGTITITKEEGEWRVVREN